jgi:integrase
MKIENVEVREGLYGENYILNNTDRIRTDYRGKIVFEFKLSDGSAKSRTFYGDDALQLAFAMAEEVIAIKEAHKNKNGIVALHDIGVPFRAYSKKVIEEYPGLEEESRENYSQVLETHIIKAPVFHGDLKKITRKQLKSFLRQLSKDTAEGIAEKAHVVLCRVFEEAVEDEIIEANPARGLHGSVFKDRKSKNRKKKYTPNPLTVTERDLFLKTAQMICCLAKLMILQVMVFSGLRLGEALALRVCHLNFDNLTVFVRQSYRKGKFNNPKNNSARTVHLPKFLMDSLMAYIRHKGLLLNDLLFQDPKLKEKLPFSQRKIQYIVQVICKKAGLKKIHPHDLRHTYSVILLMAHQSIQFVQEQLGHVSIQTTKDIYGHWISPGGRFKLEEALMSIPTGAVPAQISDVAPFDDQSEKGTAEPVPDIFNTVFPFGPGGQPADTDSGASRPVQ